MLRYVKFTSIVHCLVCVGIDRMHAFLYFFWWMVVDEGISPSLATPIVELPKKERPKKTQKEAPPKKPPSPIRVRVCESLINT